MKMKKEDHFTSRKMTGVQPPKALQPKMAGPSQPARAPQLKPHPIAPPVYRPQPTPKVLQKKTTAIQPKINTPKIIQRQPVAAPVYRPQPVPKASQKKAAGNPQALARGLERQPVAPPVFRPQPAPKVSQPSRPAVAQRTAHTSLQRSRAPIAGGSGKMKAGYKLGTVEVRNHAAHGHSVAQCVLVADNEPGYFTDSRDTNSHPRVFEDAGNNFYREMYSDETYIYYPQTDQYQASNGTYYDPYYRIALTYNPTTGYYQDSQNRVYYYDGAYYRPYQPQVVVPQQQVNLPQQSQLIINSNSTSSTSSSPQTTLNNPSVSVNNNNSASSSSPTVKDNNYFRQLINSGGMGKSIGQTLTQQTTLRGTLATLEQHAMQSASNLEQALDMLVNGSHQRGIKGLQMRLHDSVSFNATDKGHGFAQYSTYLLFAKLLQMYKGQNLDAWLMIQAECKKRDFDKKPPDGGGDGGGKGGNYRLGPSQKMIL
jgi:hypothetical protein